MNLGKRIRINRLFAHPSGNFCSVAVDHFIGYGQGLPEGLRKIQPTLKEIVAAQPDAVTMHKGIAQSSWGPYAGKIPFILQSIIARPDDSACEAIANPEDAIRLGADGFAVAIFVRGATEAAHLRLLADLVRQAAQFEMPVICHTYPRNMSGTPIVSYKPDDIAWAVRCAVEAGADVVKTPYCGEVSAFSQIVADCPVPMVAAGGPKADIMASALVMMAEVMQTGARGATIGRNVWGFNNIQGSIKAFKAVIHNRWSADEALNILSEKQAKVI